jgi:hypothetical protein
MTRLASPFAAPPRRSPPRVKRDTPQEAAEKAYVRQRDRGCVAHRALTLAGMTEIAAMSVCFGPIDVDHVRASGGLGMKSPTHRTNLASLCRHHHDAKTQFGKTWRPLLLEYLAYVEPEATA